MQAPPQIALLIMSELQAGMRAHGHKPNGWCRDTRGWLWRNVCLRCGGEVVVNREGSYIEVELDKECPGHAKPTY